MKELEIVLQELIADLKVEITSLRWRKEGGKDILEIQVDRLDGVVDLELCSLISSRIDAVIEDMVTKEDYLLEICSSGAEKELKNQEDLNKNLGKYVLAVFKEAINGVSSIKGYLKKEKDSYSIEGFIKGRKKVIDFTYDDLAKIHLSVKI